MNELLLKILGFLFSWLPRLRTEGRSRRREIRASLVAFDKEVRPIAWGDWAGSGSEPSVHHAWFKKFQPVMEKRLEVMQTMDEDRFTAGIRWCGRVESCLRTGWDLVFHVYAMCTATGIDHQKWNRDYLTKREIYQREYNRLTGRK